MINFIFNICIIQHLFKVKFHNNFLRNKFYSYLFIYEVTLSVFIDLIDPVSMI
jgi:hypothetical protein